jgi:hypothetical protein
MDEQYLRDLYTQVLGREPDPAGFAHNLALLESGAINIGELTNAFVTSPEAQQNTIPAAQEQKAAQGLLGGQGINTEERAKELADQVYGAYSSNVNYDAELNELNSLAAIDPEAFYKSRINLLGKQMGWQVGQNTSGENVRYEAELNSLLAGAQQAGLSNEEVNTLVTSGANQANRENQERIARDAAKGQGWVNQNIPGGYATLGALAAAIAAPYALGAFGGAGAAAGGTAAGGAAAGTAAGTAGSYFASLPAWVQAAAKGAAIGGATGGGVAGLTGGNVGQGLLKGALIGGATGGIAEGLSGYFAPTDPTLLSTDLANLAKTYPGMAESDLMQIAKINYGLDDFLATDISRLASQGLSASQIDQVLGYSYNPAELAGTDIKSMTGQSTGASNLLDSFSNVLKTPLGQLGAMGGLSLLGGGAQQQQPLIPQMAGGGGTYAPRGQVDYRPIIDLLAPRQISRTSLLG